MQVPVNKYTINKFYYILSQSCSREGYASRIRSRGLCPPHGRNFHVTVFCFLSTFCYDIAPRTSNLSAAARRDDFQVADGVHEPQLRKQNKPISPNKMPKTMPSN